jgi:hypothetical protein
MHYTCILEQQENIQIQNFHPWLPIIQNHLALQITNQYFNVCKIGMVLNQSKNHKIIPYKMS